MIDSSTIRTGVQCSDDEWSSANTEVRWGWKRDDGPHQRVILFSADLIRNSQGEILVTNWFFHYRQRTSLEDCLKIFHLLNGGDSLSILGPPKLEKNDGLGTLQLTSGPGADLGGSLVSRLMRRRPRPKIPVGEFPPPAVENFQVRRAAPLTIYAGSGLSYESGLPTLSTVHERFGVDRMGMEAFSFGMDDPIPTMLHKNVIKTFLSFVDLNLRAIVAKPSKSHEAIGKLWRAGLVDRIYTDNIDNLFDKVGVPFERTRGVGIFNDRFEVSIPMRSQLLVVGVAADRRGIIEQARSQNCGVVVVNPRYPVSPKSQNMSYMRSNDLWYRCEAFDFFSGLHF